MLLGKLGVCAQPWISNYRFPRVFSVHQQKVFKQSRNWLRVKLMFYILCLLIYVLKHDENMKDTCLLEKLQD